MQDVLAKLRHLIEEKELAIKYLILRSDLKTISHKSKSQSQSQADVAFVEKVEEVEEVRNEKELMQSKQLKLQILFENTIVKHFEARQEIKELTNETGNLREEIYELVCLCICMYMCYTMLAK